jgi:two-component system, OmpR family, sensor histidine kinase MprB
VTIRARLALAAALAVAIAVLIASAVAYAAVRSELREPVDAALADRADQISHLPPGALRAVETRPGNYFLQIPRPELGAAGGYVQLVTSDGQTIRPPEDTIELPVGNQVLAVASGDEQSVYHDAEVAGTHIRVLTVPLGSGYALQVARPLTEVDAALDRMRTVLILVALAGIGTAAALGLVVSRTALAPVRRLTEATEHVTATRDLTSRIDADGRDELSRLAASFNTMLGELEAADAGRRRLVADASHELRTPLTSIRTNLEVLERNPRMAATERQALLADVVEQSEELGTLVAELVQLAQGEQATPELEDVRLDLVAEEAVERAKRRRAEVVWNVELEPTLVRGVPALLERAIGNLLDNAIKWSPPGGTIDVRVSGGEVAVRDHGPGIDDEDIPHVWERFYRARAARGLPGSGLGLAIVQQAAEANGGTATAENAEDGGAIVTIRLPAEPLTDPT